MNQDEFHVFTEYLNKNYPRAFDDAMDHLTSYRIFMNKQVEHWEKLHTKNPELNIPSDIERLILKRAQEPHVVKKN